MVGRLGVTLLCAGVVAGAALAAGGNPRDPQRQHTPADQAWATAIRIHRADLGAGDWRVEQAGGSNAGAPEGCRDPNFSDLIETGKAENPDFSRGGSFVGSGAAIFLTEAQAATAWNRLAARSLTRCVVEAFQKAVAGSGVRMRVVANGPVRMPKLAPHFAASRVRFAFSGPGPKVQGRFGFYLYGQGRATALLMVASFGKPMQPIPESFERHLAEVVARRLSR
jgi:hypothetical protein